jgi:hypothetical protein
MQRVDSVVSPLVVCKGGDRSHVLLGDRRNAVLRSIKVERLDPVRILKSEQ